MSSDPLSEYGHHNNLSRAIGARIPATGFVAGLARHILGGIMSDTVWLAYHGTHRGSAHIVGVFETEEEAETALDNGEIKVRDYECTEEMSIGDAVDLLV